MTAHVEQYVDPVGGQARPGRAELRRQRETGAVEPRPAAAPSVAAPTAAPASRAEARRLAEESRRRSRRRRALWKAWWLYPLLLLLAGCVYLGVRSASTPVPDGPQWVVTSNAPDGPSAAATG